ncbi:MAG: hypothetical protein E2O61_15325 [Gammaproteobacteria bacterium]|nr:MAG: hypothetical protein E2O61_15325 [Gammaproteobacteria bacterium]
MPSTVAVFWVPLSSLNRCSGNRCALYQALSHFLRSPKRGEHAGVAMYASEQSKYAVCDELGPRHEALEPLLSS